MKPRHKPRLPALWAALLLCPQPLLSQSPAPADPVKARQAFQAATKAESEGRWEEAFRLYRDAAQNDPAQREYLERREFARFRVVQQYMDRAESAAAEGRLEEARVQIRAALAVDPGYSVAQERLQQIESMAARRGQVLAPQAPREVLLQARPGKRNINIQGSTRAVYEEVARQFGVVAQFDEALRARQVRFRVPEVDFATAMALLGQQTGTFWIAVNERTFLVADDSQQKRREFSPMVLQSVVLSGSTTPEQMVETQRLVREFAGIARVQLDTRSRTLTMRDSQENVALAVELIRDLEQQRGEIMLEVQVLELDRERARKMGIVPPSQSRVFTITPEQLDQLQNPQSPAALAELLQSIFGTTFTGSFSGLIPPLVAIGGGRTVALVTLPGATAEFAETLSVVRSARRMLLRSEDTRPATFFVGERFPVNLSILTQNPAGAGQLPQQTEFPAGETPRGAVVFDFDRDGNLDIAVANQASNTISVLLGNGAGIFGDPAAFPTGSAPVALAAGDFDGDANLDLAVANLNGATVSVLLGNGDGTFGAPTDFATGQGPSDVRAVDLDGDGLLDLVVANQTDNTVSVLLGNGDGTFATAVDFSTGAGPVALATGDFNGDNFTDVVSANQAANSVSVLLGDGAGAFGPATDFATGAGPSAVVVTTLDGGSVADLAVANAAGDSVTLMLGNGDGTFGARVDFAAGAAPADIAALDIDGDSNVDLVTINQDDDTASVLLGDGAGGLTTRFDFPTGAGPVSLALGDFNGDGRSDAVVANLDGNSVTVLITATALGAVPAAFQGLPYPGFQYEDLGLKVRATPRLHLDREVTLQLQIEIRSRTGQSLNGIPVISNRTVENTVRLRLNETSVVTGLIQRQGTSGVAGWPGLAALPGVGYAVGTKDSDVRETELLIAVTPRQLRLAPRTGRAIFVGRDPAAATGPPR